MLLSFVLLLLCSAGYLSAIQLPQPGNQANVATGTTNIMITATVTTSPTACTWSGTGLTATQFYSSAFGRCQTVIPTATRSITCTNVPGGFSTSLTYLTAMTSNTNVSLTCDSAVVYSLLMVVKECSSPTPNNVPVNPSSGVYNTQANFQCSHGSTLFYVNGTTGNNATKCLATAEWENENIVQCWSAPTATLIGNNTICAGNIATFQCTASGGVPSLDRVEIYFNNQNQTLVGNTWTSNPLSSSNKGDIVECRAINSYTAMQEYTNLGRDSKTLIVHYQATNPKFETKFTDLLINSSSDYLLRSDETLTMKCSADGNPAVTCTWSCYPTNCGSLPNACEINNVKVTGFTTITCTVGNGVCGGGTTSITQHITVVPVTRDPYFIIDGGVSTATSITRNKTESLSLVCAIQNQNEMNTLIILKKDGIINFGSDNVTINNLSPEDTGSYSCHTSDAFGNFSSSLYVDVYYPATNPKFETKFTDLLINSSSGYLLRSDETLTMNCSADGNPAVTCNWTCSPTHCGLPNTCEINNVNVVGSTTITCTVGNGVCGGGTTSITQHITVVPKTRTPNVLVDGVPSTASSITRNKTESLSLACAIQNQNEMNTKIAWKKDGFVRSIGSLYIPSVASSDDGLYVCETSDAFGNFSTSVSLTVLYPAEKFQIINGLGTLCEWGTKGPQYCNITFLLNPATHSAILKKNGLIADNDMEYKPQSTIIQNYVFMKNQPTQNDTGSYTLTVTSSTFTPVIFSFTVLVSNPIVVPKDNTATIVGAVLGSIIAILLIIITFLVVKLYRNKKPETSHPRSEGNTNTAADDYVELNQPTNRSHTSQPVVRSQQSTNYENLKDNVNVTRDEQGYADLQSAGPSVVTTPNDGYEVFIRRNNENTAGNQRNESQYEHVA
ncbi:uncharacterized protein LOC100178478 isoform X5 [Ciona intestinalis]